MESSDWLPRRTRALPPWGARAVDLVLCLLVLTTLTAVLRAGGSPEDRIAPALQAAAALALLFRRTAPMWVMALMLVAAVPMVTEGVSPGTLPAVDESGVWVPLAAPFACYSATVFGANLRLAWALTGALTLVATRPWAPDAAIVAPGLLLTAVPALAGMYVRSQHRLADVLRDRVERAEREQHLLAERARSEERARLAVEMHDIVTHRVSLMVLHAGALRMTTREDATRRAAEELRAAGHQALEELREFLGVLRSPAGERTVADGAAPGRAAGEAAGPDLEDLIAESAAAGVRIAFTRTGDSGVVSPVIGRTVYRVVQESLSNAIKHAPGAAVEVRARYGREHVRLTIRNAEPGHGPPADAGEHTLSRSGSGVGLLGLRRRVGLVGGELHAGPSAGGGFEVEARLPVFVPAKEAVRGGS
ncbi:sensor histidine kinase [Actinomycetota bacterium Odt1-20B]